MRNSGTVVDVRTADEFRTGNVPGSVNIPLQEIAERMEEVRLLQGPIFLCCASGARSAIAAQYIAQQGIECRNAGSWRELSV